MFHDIEQNTDEWFKLRAGKITGSAISCIMANYPNCFGGPAKELASKLCVEQITGNPISTGLNSYHIRRGHEEEPLAIMQYEEMFFCNVANGGFFDNGVSGCSPDGLVNDDGIIEVKSVIASQQYKNIKRGSFDPAYVWQLAFNLRETKRQWVDYVSFCSDFPDGKQLFVFRVSKDELKEEFNFINQRLDKFQELVEERKKEINDFCPRLLGSSGLKEISAPEMPEDFEERYVELEYNSQEVIHKTIYAYTKGDIEDMNKKSK